MLQIPSRRKSPTLFVDEWLSEETPWTWNNTFGRTSGSSKNSFHAITGKTRGGQLSITGNVVNVPADVTSTVKKLPKVMSENDACELRPVSRINVKKVYLYDIDFFVVSVFIKKRIKEKKYAISIKHMKCTFTMRV